MIPASLHDLSLTYLGAGLVAALIISADVIRHPQRMGIMNVVWPLTALFGTAGVLWLYFSYGRQATPAPATAEHTQTPFRVSVSEAALHCGSGCVLGDICAEWLVFAQPAVAVAFGWHTLFAEKLFATWIIDYLFAFVIGIAFQYLSMAPGRLSARQRLLAAIKADTLSLTAWQVGMYGFMAFAHFVVFGRWLGGEPPTSSVEFWFAMQLGMLCGFATAYPVNAWLIRHDIKQKM